MSKGNPSYIITKNDAARVQSLSCPVNGIKNLSGLENFTALQKLDLTGNKLTDGSFFTKLNTLHTLKVADNQLPNLNVQGLTYLNILEASNNQLKTFLQDAGAYYGYLDLSNNALSGALNLSNQPNLTYLDVSNNQLTSIGDLSSSAILSTVLVDNNSVTTIGNVSKAYNNGQGYLLYMNLSCNLPFLCNTLGLDTATGGSDFVKESLCGVNNLPECGSSQTKTNNVRQKSNSNDKKKKKTTNQKKQKQK
jgi:Leucine-rich repeat (LRR) protein